jgi:sugar-specific transcriptional regulator TrmB
MTESRDHVRMLERLDLKEYEAKALAELLSLGRTTAPDLSEATGIPKARIYGVLDSLADLGFVKVIPGRPKEYQPHSPEDILDRAVENRRQDFETYREQIVAQREVFLEELGPLFETASSDITPTEELFYVVDAGDPSERKTRTLYHKADDEINIITKGMDYFDRVEASLHDAIDQGIAVQILFLEPSSLSQENRARQQEVIDAIDSRYPEVSYRFSNGRLPWRGTFIDPSMDYESGQAILLVEEEDVPMSMRQAAVTENAPFVAGLKRYFDLIWEHDASDQR